MGIVNVTPDSFSDGGRYFDTYAAVEHGCELAKSGADILDVGGESTRPGATPLNPQEETDRVAPVIQALREKTRALISVDTYHAHTAAAALEAGADIINDISANPDIMRLAAQTGATLVIMHMQGRPLTMQQAPSYRNVVLEVKAFLLDKVKQALDAGVERKSVIIDPGVGFGKSLQHNVQLLRELHELTRLPYPLLLGVSRKRFLSALSGEAFGGPGANLAANIWGVIQGAKILRVHEVEELRRALDVLQPLMN